MAEYRAGRYESAIKWLDQGENDLHGSPRMTSNLLTAMAQQRLGMHGRAIRGWNSAVEYMAGEMPPSPDIDGDDNVENWCIAQIIFREARTMFDDDAASIMPTTMPSTRP